MERPTLAKALAACEQRRVQLQRDLAVLDGTARASTVDVKGIEKALRGKLKDWRKALDKLIVGLVPSAGQALPSVWRARRDLNPRPTGSKPAALSN